MKGISVLTLALLSSLSTKQKIIPMIRLISFCLGGTHFSKLIMSEIFCHDFSITGNCYFHFV